MSLPAALLVSVVLLALNAFFTASEFALVAAKRPALTERANSGSKAARAAVHGMRELSITLAGAQLGITLCSLGIGAVAEPLLDHLLRPAFQAAHVPATAAGAVSFALGLAIVTFCHLVIGEMVPKSWVIAHPETAALAVAPPFRMFAVALRPILVALNEVTNLALRAVRVDPRGSLEDHGDPGQLRLLIAESARLGLITPTDRALLNRSMETQVMPVESVMIPRGRVAAVPADASPEEIVGLASRSGYHRLPVFGDDPGRDVVGTVHVRDALLAQARQRHATAAGLCRPLPTVTPRVTVPEVFELLRRSRAMLAAIAVEGRWIGVVSMSDLLEMLLGSTGVESAAESGVRSAAGDEFATRR